MPSPRCLYARSSHVTVIDDDRHEEWLAVRHVVSAIDRKLPLAPEVTFQPCLRSARDDRHEQSAIVDVLPNLTVPDITASQLALVEPHLDAGGSERVANVPRGFRILLECVSGTFSAMRESNHAFGGRGVYL